MSVRSDAQNIIGKTISACLPDEAVHRALSGHSFGPGRVLLVAIGKAAWQMASCAAEILGERLDQGIVITKYGHSRGPIPVCRIFEAAHPVPDRNSFLATRHVLDMVRDLGEDDQVLFLISGGGSALFEWPLIPDEDLFELTQQMLSCGADIVEINTIRKRLSAVKGGRFAQCCAPAKVFSVVLSDIIGDPLDMIASGPAYPDNSTCEEAMEIVRKYGLTISRETQKRLLLETPKSLDNAETIVTGSVRELCMAAARACADLGYTPVILTDRLCCQAKEAGSFLASVARSHENTESSIAFIAGGETVVYITGSGKGGRNQELALSAAVGIDGMVDTVIFSLGSDGTDGPTDAAGGIVDGSVARELRRAGILISDTLAANDAYHALQKVGGLIMTGPTGTNVNDVAVVLLKRKVS